MTWDETGLGWEKSGERVFLKWDEISGLRPLPEKHLLRGRRNLWRVHSSRAEFTFSLILLSDAGGLPALIYQCAPQIEDWQVILPPEVWPELHRA